MIIIKRTCKHCRRKFQVSEARVKSGHGIYCSKKCQHNYDTRVERICKRCGKRFSIHPSKIKIGEGVYCSYSCHFPIIEKICICGRKFRVRHSAVFCSKKCFHANKPKKPPAERFWKHVKKGKGCWTWTGSRNKKGYGHFGISTNKMVLAHRFSYELKNGEIKDGLFILHKCDNPSCVNPDHLFEGTNQDNRDDMCRKGRQYSVNSKMTKEKVLKLRKLEGAMTNIEIAKMFGINPSHVSQIILRKAWKHI